ncbi:MAG: nitrilase-related carbon-nitrogen hydrolase [Litorilinea sp.]
MDSLIVATVQQQMQICSSHADYQEDLRRFLKVATAKRARLVIFPELGGLVVAPPMLGDFRSTLIKRAELGQARRASLWEKLSGGAANLLANWFQADLRLALAGLLDVAHADLWSVYCETFGGLAREFGVTVVAPSGYFPDPRDGVIRSLSAVFDENGELLGTQAKVVLHVEDKDLAQPGSTWDVIPTAVGRLGLILGADVLFPEVGRVLAYQGADVLAVQAASTDVLLYNKIRTGVLARMQDNQLFAAASFLIGPNRMSRRSGGGAAQQSPTQQSRERSPYVGKSAIFAPQELTPRKSGVLVEMTSRQSEGVLTAVWDFAALRELWESSETPVRRDLPLDQAGQILGQLYSRLEHLPGLLANDVVGSDSDIAGSLEMHDVDEPGDETASNRDRKPATRNVLTLDELEVRSSITSRWPVASAYAVPDALAADVEPVDDEDTPDTQAEGEPGGGLTWPDAEMVGLDAGADDEAAGEDETDEMDALPRKSS